MRITNDAPITSAQNVAPASQPANKPEQAKPAAQEAGPAAVYDPSTEAKGVAAQAASSKEADAAPEEGQGKATYSSTEDVDREIEKLKKQAQELEARVGRTADPASQANLQQQLEQVQKELAQKDTDSYRKEHAKFWEA